MVQLQRVLGVPLAADADSAWPVGAVPRPLHRAFALTLAAGLTLLLAACGAPSAFVLATASPVAAPAPAASRMAAEAPVDSRIVTAASALVSQDVAPLTSGQSAVDLAAAADAPKTPALPQSGTLAARQEADRLAPGQMLQASPNPLPAPKPEAVTSVPILMYHYIRDVPASSPDKLGYGLSVAPKLFDQQVSWLAANGYTSISMGQLADHLAGGVPLPPKPIVLTFDDGYADFYTAALPILQRYHFRATSYLVVDFLGKPGYMSWQQAQAVQQAGLEVGDHTLDHVDLAIQLLPQAQRQIGDSRTMLQQRLGAPIGTFAYPSGRYNDSVVKMVGADGFRSAVTTDPGDRYTAAKVLTLPRVRVSGGESVAALAKSLA